MSTRLDHTYHLTLKNGHTVIVQVRRRRDVSTEQKRRRSKHVPVLRKWQVTDDHVPFSRSVESDGRLSLPQSGGAS